MYESCINLEINFPQTSLKNQSIIPCKGQRFSLPALTKSETKGARTAPYVAFSSSVVRAKEEIFIERLCGAASK